jgi:glucose/arabinose dehydrogenase
MRSNRRWLAGLTIMALLVGVPVVRPPLSVAAATLPAGFSDTLFASGFGGRLTAMTFAPDGRLFVSEKQGAIRIVKNGTLLTRPFLTLATNTDAENGLKAIDFDPNFAANGRFYVYYTDSTTVLNRVSRFTVSQSDPDVADPASEVVLVDGIATGVFHSAGALHFGSDGRLYVSTGDGSYGPNAQDLTNLNGKILRINTDGSIPADNPYVGQANVRPEIWANGLRNPFTFAFDPGSQRMLINDVGNSTWEEIDAGQAGANYGWPTCEGTCNDARFVNPVYSYNHNDGPGKSITGAVFYRGSMFPSDYRGDYFFGDYVGNYIKRFNPQTGAVTDFATNALNPVDLDIGPDGALYYLSVEAKTVDRIAFGAGPPPPPPPDPSNAFQNPGFEQNAPFAYPAAWRASVTSPAKATVVRDTTDFESGTASARVDVTAASRDWHVQLLQPNVPLTANQVETLTFWARSSSNQAVRAAFQKNAAPYPVYVEKTFSIGATWQQYTLAFTPTTTDAKALFNFNLGASTGSVWIDDVDLATTTTIGATPVPVITAPVEGTTFRAGDTISYAGNATDKEDGTIPPARLTWEIVFHHDTHTHPFIEPFSGATSGSFVAPITGEASANVWYRIHLTATDSDGNSASVTRDVIPITSQFTVATQPAGLSLTLDGSPLTAPQTIIGVVGFQREIGAPASQTLNGTTYQFTGWSDNGNPTHGILTPQAATTYTATYSATGATSNSFQDPGFEQNIPFGYPGPWRSSVTSPATATVTRDTSNPASGAASARIDVTTASRDWHVQLLQPNVPLTGNQVETLMFSARATGNRTIRVAFQRNSAPYPVYIEKTFSVTTAWQTYTLTFTPTTTDAKTLFNFNLGIATGSVWIDDVTLSP